MNKIILFFIITCLFSISFSQNNSYSDFKNIESICYCNTSESTPDAILKLDNNWEIVQSLISAKSASQLDSAGIKYTISQLKLLEQWSLISRSDDEKYQTAIIVFDSIKTTELRQYSIMLSKKLSVIIKDDVIELISRLKTINRGKNIYTILFSYILDGMVWDYLDEAKLLPDNGISVKRPFWNGEFWITYPKREFSCGTNSISDSGYSIKVNWSEKTIPKMLPFVSRWDLLGKIMNDLISKGKVEDKNSIEVFGPYKIFDSDGKFTVPVIIENENNSLYLLSKEMASKVTSFIIKEIDYDYIIKEFGFNNKAQAVIILYHEMLWDILDILETNKQITKPIAFSDPGNSVPEDISDLVIITKRYK